MLRTPNFGRKSLNEIKSFKHNVPVSWNEIPNWP